MRLSVEQAIETGDVNFACTGLYRYYDSYQSTRALAIEHSNLVPWVLSAICQLNFVPTPIS